MGRPVPEIDPGALDGAAVLRALGIETGGVRVERIRRGVLRYAWATGALIGKVYETEAAGRRGFEGMRALWESDFCARAPERVRVPEPHAYLPELRLLLMEEVPGEPLRRLVRKAAIGAFELGLVAAALAKLHRAPPVTSRRVGVEEHLRERCASLVPCLTRAFPELADPVERILASARRAEADAAFALAHGDCHLGQLLVEGGSLWIVDLDSLHVGDPAYDLAMVCLKLPEPGWRRELLATYARAGGAEGAAQRIPVQMALIQLKRACKRFRFQDEPGWPEAVRREVREGADRLFA